MKQPNPAMSFGMGANVRILPQSRLATFPLSGKAIIADATIVSLSWPYKHHPVTSERVRTMLRDRRVLIPSIVLEVINRGIDLVHDEREHAEELAAWRDSLPDLGFTIVSPTEKVERIVNEMKATKQLNNFWMTCRPAEKEKIPHEIYVAATSISLGIKIASLKSWGYQIIEDAGFFLPGWINLDDPLQSSGLDSLLDHPQSGTIH